MRKNLARVKIGTLQSLTIGLLFITAGLLVILQVNYYMRQQALAEAESKARILLDRNMATHTYFTEILKPSLFKWTDPFRPTDYFDPSWMSSTYAVRQIDQYFKSFSTSDYSLKDAAVNARTPENEADADERAFLEALEADPTMDTRSYVRAVDGVPYFVFMRTGEVLEAACLPCHADPAQAPADLVSLYGAERGFHREADVGKVVSAISIRVPLAAAYAAANRYSARLSGLLLVSLAGLFLAQSWLNKRLVLAPLATIRDKARQIATDENRLGERIPAPFGQELGEMATAFNTMSAILRRDRDELEQRIMERTADLTTANEHLESDIAARKRTESEREAALEALRESEARFRELFENIQNGVAVYAVVGDGEDFIFEDFNRAGERIDNDRRERLIGKSIFAVRPGAEQFGLIEVLRRVWQTGEPAHHPVTLYQDGRLRRWYENFVFKLQSGEIVAVFDDITPAKQAEEEIRRMALMLDTAPNSITVHDLDGRFIYANQRTLDLLGFTGDEFMALNLRQLDVPDSARLFAPRLQELFDRGEATFEAGHYRKDGSTLPLEISATVTTWGDTRVILSVATDITARQRAEAQREAALEALRASLAEKDVLFREVHHRVKNNLATIVGLLGLQRETMADTAAQDQFRELEGRIRSMALIHETLYQSENLARIELQGYLETLIAQLRTALATGSHVRISVAAAGVEMGLDTAVPCGLILNELITNSLKYALPCGKPRPGETACEIAVSAEWDGRAEAGGVYTMTVADNGVGLPADLDWATTKSLGLRLVRLLAQQQLGGSIEIDRAGGTRFALRFGAAQGR